MEINEAELLQRSVEAGSALAARLMEQNRSTPAAELGRMLGEVASKAKDHLRGVEAEPGNPRHTILAQTEWRRFCRELRERSSLEMWETTPRCADCGLPSGRETGSCGPCPPGQRQSNGTLSDAQEYRAFAEAVARSCLAAAQTMTGGEYPLGELGEQLERQAGKVLTGLEPGEGHRHAAGDLLDAALENIEVRTDPAAYRQLMPCLSCGLPNAGASEECPHCLRKRNMQRVLR